MCGAGGVVLRAPQSAPVTYLTASRIPPGQVLPQLRGKRARRGLKHRRARGPKKSPRRHMKKLSFFLNTLQLKILSNFFKMLEQYHLYQTNEHHLV